MEMAAQFVRFGVVGVIGFVFYTATVYALRAPLGLTARASPPISSPPRSTGG